VSINVSGNFILCEGNASREAADFQNRFPASIKQARVGFMRSTTTSASTKDLVEVLYIELVNPVEHFEDLIRFFFSFHDPTTLNRQGADRGLAYASFIFCADLEQLEIANRVKTELQRRIDCGCVNCFSRARIQTRVVNITKFIEANEKDQQYSRKNPKGYCNHFIRTRNQKPPKVERLWKLKHLPIAFIPTN